MTTHPLPRSGRGLTATLLALALGLVACGGGAASSASQASPTTPTATPPASAVPSPTDGLSATAAPSKEVVPVDPTIVPAPDGGVPAAIVAAAVDDAATRAGVPAADVTVVSAQAVTWPNGAAGCPKPGFMYTDVITPGYRVVLEAGGTTYDYRGSARAGSVTWCENARPMG